MSRGGDHHKGHEARKPLPAGDGVVRSTKLIPTLMKPVADFPEPQLACGQTHGPALGQTMDLPCSGRCGHCDCHPCRLHGPI
ncbi:hypothetical protein [Geothrix sp.]|uniref:hypothetical protein n=1 Tax=Geothrix sp. TaxID=1962974 RepID=UPI0025C66CE8|nr:hypothetical protein [Geothrix sp.]